MSGSNEYFKVGNSISDDFYLIDSTAAAVTGKVQANFTFDLTKNGTGNQSTTGITLTEVSSVTDPGVYHLDISGSTGFPAATGTYILKIYVTADSTLVVVATYRVTSDGTGAGTVGPVSFTATAADGRITDGASALSGATVLIKRSTGVAYTSFTTSATGVWGPAYFTDADTYTISAFKSGYSTSNTGTLAVTGTPASAVTGPLADIALSVSTSGTGLLLSDLLAYARRMARNGTGTQADTELKECVNDALLVICQRHLWSHYKTHLTLSLNAQQTTGTVAINNASTTCTLAGANWPTAAASGKIIVNGQIQRISSRTSNADVVLAKAWQEASVTAATYTYFQDEYSLPDDCMKFGTLIPGQSHPWGGAVEIGFEQMLEAQGMLALTYQFPSAWCTHASSGTAKIMLYPAPSENFLLPAWYYRRPALLVSASDASDFMPGHIELLHRAIDYQVSLHFSGCVAGTPQQTAEAFEKALAHSITHDNRAVVARLPTNRTATRSPLGNFRVTQ